MTSPVATFQEAAFSIRRFFSDFVALFAVEARIASMSLVRLVILGVIAGMCVLTAWVFLWMGVAVTLVDSANWAWQHVLYLLAVVHIAITFGILMLARKTARCAFFPGTLAQVRSQEPDQDEHREGMRELEDERELREQSLNDAKHEIIATFDASKAKVKETLAKPGVIGGALTLGVILGLRGRKRHHEPPAPTQAPSTMAYVLRPIVGQLAVLAIAAATKWIESRQRARYQSQHGAY